MTRRVLIVDDEPSFCDLYAHTLRNAGLQVDTAASADTLDVALGIWHGLAFGEFADRPEVHGEAARLDELKLAATDEWAEAKMAIGSPAGLRSGPLLC